MQSYRSFVRRDNKKNVLPDNAAVVWTVCFAFPSFSNQDGTSGVTSHGPSKTPFGYISS